MYVVHEGLDQPISSWQPATPEEIARIEAILQEKAACTVFALSTLPKAFHGFLDPHTGLGGIPDPKYTSVLEKQLLEQGGA